MANPTTSWGLGVLPVTHAHWASPATHLGSSVCLYTPQAHSEARCLSTDYTDKPLEKPLKLVLKVGGSEVTELSGSGHDSSYYDDRSDHERERHKEKKKKKKKKSEKEKHLDDEERRKRKVKQGCSWHVVAPSPLEGRLQVLQGLRKGLFYL